LRAVDLQHYFDIGRREAGGCVQHMTGDWGSILSHL
jgi:hypothetical protein